MYYIALFSTLPFTSSKKNLAQVFLAEKIAVAKKYQFFPFHTNGSPLPVDSLLKGLFSAEMRPLGGDRALFPVSEVWREHL